MEKRVGKMKRKWIMLALSLLLVIALSACSSSGSGNSNKKVTLDIFQFKVEFKKQFGELAKLYEKDHPNVKVNITTVGGGSDYGAALKSKFASGNEPTIYNIGGPSDVKDWKAKLADLSGTKAAELALPGTLKGVQQGSKVYGLPFNEEGYGLLYNKQVFKKAGIDPSSIKSMDDLKNVSRKLDQNKSKLGIKAVYAFPAKETWVTGLHASNVFLSPEFDQDVTKAFESKTVSFKYGKQFKQYLDLQQNYSIQPTASLDYSAQVEQYFSNGKVAMIQQGVWVASTIAGISKDFEKNNVGIIPIPVDGFKTDSIPVGVPMYWAVNSNKSSAEIKAAKDFLNYMYTSDTGKKIVLEKFQFIPAYSGYDSSKIQDSLARQIYEYAQNKKTIGWVFMGYPTGWGQNTLGADIQKYTSGKMSWDALIKDAQNGWKSARNQ
jgi:raffinose/stachyose/melibiose transport system substrate-binding protein